jgi:hypothetical protein
VGQLGQWDKDNRLGLMARCHSRIVGCTIAVRHGDNCSIAPVATATTTGCERLESSSRGLPLTGDAAASDIFPWARVKDDRSLHGPGSIAEPGVEVCEAGTNSGATEIFQPWGEAVASALRRCRTGVAWPAWPG